MHSYIFSLKRGQLWLGYMQFNLSALSACTMHVAAIFQIFQIVSYTYTTIVYSILLSAGDTRNILGVDINYNQLSKYLLQRW